MIYSVIGLAFGDEGKGKVVASLTQHVDPFAIVRFSGGSQAAHRVVVNGKSHIFAQFGSGSAVSDTVMTYLSHQMAIDPITLMGERNYHRSNGIKNLFKRLRIDSESPMITPYHILLNRAKEYMKSEDKKVSTTGMGVGETFIDIKNRPGEAIRIKDLLNRKILREKLFTLKQHTDNMSLPCNLFPINIESYYYDLIEISKVIKDCIVSHDTFIDDILMNTHNDIIFEGSQGTMLDMRYGYHPYVTKSFVTLSEVRKLIGNGIQSFNIGVTRSYMVRHGRGPFPSEDKNLTILLPDAHNTYNKWQGEFRVGWLDLDTLKYSIKCNDGLNGIAVTCLDRLPSKYSLYFDGKRHKYKNIPISELIKNHINNTLPIVFESREEEQVKNNFAIDT